MHLRVGLRRADRSRVNDLDRAICRAVSALPPGPLDTAMKGLARREPQPAVVRGGRACWPPAAGRAARPRCAGCSPSPRPAHGQRRAQAAAPAPPPRRRRAPRLPDASRTRRRRRRSRPGTRRPRPRSPRPSRWRAHGSALVVAPLAAAVAYSRVHVGVHWASDVLVGAAIGAAVALATRRWWPVRLADEARARPLDTVPELPRRQGPGDRRPTSAPATPNYDPADELEEALPDAQSSCAPSRTATSTSSSTKAVAEPRERVARASAWPAATARSPRPPRWPAGARLPLVVVPTGTLNHFARDVGVYDLQEAVDATGAGEAVAVDLALVDVHPGRGTDRPTPVVRTRFFLNTASLGSYPELVRLREQWQRAGASGRRSPPRWSSCCAAPSRCRVRIDGEWHEVWFLFVGNGPYYPRGFVPAWRPSLDSGPARRPLAARRHPVLPRCARCSGCCSARSGTAASTSSARSPSSTSSSRCPACSPPTARSSGGRPLHVPRRTGPDLGLPARRGPLDRAATARSRAEVRTDLVADRVADGLGRAAGRGLPWLAVACALAGHRGPRRRAAMRGALALGLSGALTAVVPGHRRTLSGYAATATAFTAGVAQESPRAAVAVAPLAAAVAWSRVRTAGGGPRTCSPGPGSVPPSRWRPGAGGRSARSARRTPARSGRCRRCPAARACWSSRQPVRAGRHRSGRRRRRGPAARPRRERRAGRGPDRRAGGRRRRRRFRGAGARRGRRGRDGRRRRVRGRPAPAAAGRRAGRGR